MPGWEIARAELAGSGAGRWAKRPSYTRAENDATPHIHVR